jgi:hypothetical protein
MFSSLGLDPDRVPETLAGCSYYGEGQQLTIGSQVADLPRAWFRSTLLPDGTSPLEDFLVRLKAHIAQLGKFFLLPQPEGSFGEISRWAESVEENLDVLFGSDHGEGLRTAELVTKRIRALEAAVDAVSNADAEARLTPRFLEWDLVRPSYPMPETPLVSKKTKSIMSMLASRSPEELHREKQTISLLRVKLMRRWKWPVGIALLRDHHESKDYRDFILKGQAPWRPLEIEVAELLKESERAYPILSD